MSARQPWGRWTAVEDAWLEAAHAADAALSGEQLARGLTAARIGPPRCGRVCRDRVALLKERADLAACCARPAGAPAADPDPAPQPDPARPSRERKARALDEQRRGWGERPCDQATPAERDAHRALARRVIDRVFSHGTSHGASQ